MREELYKYLGKRVKVTKINGESFFLKVLGSGKTKEGDYISGFDDERINQRVYIDKVFMIQMPEEPKIKRY